MKNIFLRLLLFLVTSSIFSQNVAKVIVVNDDQGSKLVVNGKDFIVNGINWDYVPIGYNVLDAKFWEKPDEIIKAALDEEMPLWQNMGVNAIRTYIGMPPKWITYMYENFGIYTMINHQFGAYGLTIDGVWNPQTKYADPKVRKHLIDESVKMTKMYANTPGLLLFMLGNENNYHLTWEGAETDEGIVINDQDEAKRAEARAMYKLFNDATLAMKKVDTSHPIGICNGDLLYLDIVAEQCKDIDIYGTNMYRGESFVDAFDRIKNEFNKPVLFTEFGSDAFNARDNKEDQLMQAIYMLSNWKEIYENAYGLGKAENSLGGFTFQSSDGWFKSGFDERKNADVHDTKANWPSNGYSRDQAKPGDKNMNEEWFGIAAKGPTDVRGLYTLYPRASYYALKEAHQFNPFASSYADFQSHFAKINLMDAVLRARGDRAALGDNQKIKLSNLRAEFTTFNTGGSLLTTPEFSDGSGQTYPDRRGFDHMQSYYVGVAGKPSENMSAEVNFNILGNVAGNPIDDIFYENVGRPIQVDSPNGVVTLTDNNRLRVYNAEFEWNAKDFDMRGFYRTGHYHWGYEGDLFGLYPEAYYGPNLDIYNGEILGVEVDGKGVLDGVKAAFGPQLWWGANPAVLLKYTRKLGNYDFSALYHKDIVSGNGIDANGNRVLDPTQARTGVIPALPTERATIAIAREFDNFGFQLGAIWAGRPLNGRTYQVTTGTAGNYTVFNDRIQSKDNWGGKAKVTYTKGGFNAYAQGSIMGLVANGGADQTLTFTGWKLKDSGSGNMTNFLTGFAYNFGSKWQVAPNFMYQKPLVGPMPNDIGAPGRLRNFVDDPFAVRAGSRETTAGEILLTFDPTPATYMYEFDNDRAEDAKFAMNLGFVYRHLPTTQDAAIGFQANRSLLRFANSAPAQDLWELHSRVISKLRPEFGFISNFYYGTGQANGDSERTITRFGADLRMIYNKMKLTGMVKVNDWGPFDYHRDFNLTFPLQFILDFSTSVGKPDWFILPDTKVGIMGTWRSLNQYSPRYSPNATSSEFATAPTISPVGFPNGSEWEIRTYIHINIGK
ncbi:MAG: glycoside hydrolase family 2 TIM barrel-domain containing protein [Polaribacter sp.]|uniref:glycoside hydrolase family 2 TIM barrel-domain containing protein n=1 Tax=Polaribacter sp. TaxID=1920175 RepID=UPI003BB082C5